MSLIVVIILGCILGNAFFAGIETGVISINRIRLRHHVEAEKRWAVILQGFLSHPEQLLGTTLAGTNLCMIVASILTASVGKTLLGAWGEIVCGIMLTALVLVFAEYLPKAWFQNQPMEHCRPFAGLLQLSWTILRPLSATVTKLTDWVVPAPPQTEGAKTQYPFVTRDELKVLAEEGEEHGMLSPKQRIMIHRVFELSGKTAAQVMIPRSKMVVVSSHTTLGDFLRVAQQSAFTRMPVFDAEQKTFVGVVNLFEALANQTAEASTPIPGFMRAPLFIRDTMPLTEIFPSMRLSRQPMCLVTDAHAEVIGLITTQDLVEEIVGKL